VVGKLRFPETPPVCVCKITNIGTLGIGGPMEHTCTPSFESDIPDGVHTIV
jgi:hypothetical protein